MKKILIILLSTLTVSMSAQIVEFSDDLLSLFEDKKQEEILTKPIDLDSLYPSVDLGLSVIGTNTDYNNFAFTYGRGRWRLYPNFIGYHVFMPQRQTGYPAEEVLSFSSNYDTVTFGAMPKGIYEVVGMVVTAEDCEDINELINGSKICIGKKKTFDPRRMVGSIRELNMRIHNKYSINTDNAMLVFKGEDEHLYYLPLSSASREAHIQDGAFLVEQYDYIKDILLHNKWYLGKPSEKFSIETKDGLRFQFADTVGVSVRELAVKEGEFIAIMKVGPDSIVYHCPIKWEKTKYFNREYIHPYEFVSDTLEYLSFKCDYRESQILVRKDDYARINDINKNFNIEIEAYKNKKEAELAARKAAIEEARRAEYEQLKKEIEQQRKQEKQSLIAKYGEKYGILIFEHKVSLGMTKEMCAKAWGFPRNKTIRRKSNGTREVWVYGLAQYLIFENGILVESASNY